MKRIGWLWHDVIDIENVFQAMLDYNSNRPKWRRRRPCYVKAAEIAARMAADFAEAVGSPSTKTIFEAGKQRELEIPSYESCIAQLALWRVCGKYVERRVHDQSFSSRRGKGGHLAAKKCERFIRIHIGDLAKYHLYFDVRKFYAHIDKRIMMDRLATIFKDPKVLEAFRAVVYSTPHGLPIGYPFSHALANLYLAPLYYLLLSSGRRQYRVSRIFVYMDNWIVFSRYKKVLHAARAEAKRWLSGVGCEMKGDWQVAPTASRRVKICGFALGCGRAHLYRRIWRRIMRNVDAIRRHMTQRLYRSLMSRLGWSKAIHMEHNAVCAGERKALWR